LASCGGAKWRVLTKGFISPSLCCHRFSLSGIHEDDVLVGTCTAAAWTLQNRHFGRCDAEDVNGLMRETLAGFCDRSVSRRSPYPPRSRTPRFQRHHVGLGPRRAAAESPGHPSHSAGWRSRPFQGYEGFLPPRRMAAFGGRRHDPRHSFARKGEHDTGIAHSLARSGADVGRRRFYARRISPCTRQEESPARGGAFPCTRGADGGQHRVNDEPIFRGTA
jgi:hypothetical protein